MSKLIRKIIEIDEELCNGCGQCVPSCAEGALVVVDGKARVVKDMYCDGLGACLGECPTGALKIVEREADAFDEEAAMAFVAARDGKASAHGHGAASAGCGGGCPGQALATFERATAAAPEGGGEAGAASPCLLGHWPVQIRLIPPDAPFLLGADLVVAADCAAVAHPDFHREFAGRGAVMIGCPKFDGEADYVGRFTEIFARSGVASVTVVRMEVPCCMGLPAMVREAQAASGRMDIPVREVVIGRRGERMRAL